MRILIVEDSEIYRKLLERYLNKYLVFIECKSIATYDELKNVDEEFDLYLVDFILFIIFLIFKDINYKELF